MRVAFATKDGKFVSQHFGHAPSFCIIEIDDTTYEWHVLEKRENIPSCQFGQHNEAAFAKSVEAVSDCTALFVAKVGPYARSTLQLKGMQVLEITGIIEEVLAGYIEYLKKQKRREHIAQPAL